MINVGFGGSNSVIILDETPISHQPENHVKRLNSTNRYQNGDVAHGHTGSGPLKRLYVLSARSESSLTTYLSSLSEYLDNVSAYSTFMADLCYTLGQRRTHHPHRVAVIADSLESLKTELATVKPRKARDQNIAFIFTGQGAQ